jgi:hypothetical protein
VGSEVGHEGGDRDVGEAVEAVLEDIDVDYGDCLDELVFELGGQSVDFVVCTHEIPHCTGLPCISSHSPASMVLL